MRCLSPASLLILVVGTQKCVYVNEDGFCYITPGQQYCDKHQADPRCFTHDGNPPKQWCVYKRACLQTNTRTHSHMHAHL